MKLISLIMLLCGLAVGWQLRVPKPIVAPAKGRVVQRLVKHPALGAKADTVAKDQSQLSLEETKQLFLSSVALPELSGWAKLLTTPELEELLKALLAGSEEELSRYQIAISAAMGELLNRDYDLSYRLASRAGGMVRATMMSYVLGQLAALDPARGLEESHKLGAVGFWGEGALYHRWLEVDPFKALEAWDRMPQTGDGVGSLQMYAKTRPLRELPALAAAAAKIRRQPLGANAVAAVMRAWAAFQPDTALSFATDYAERVGRAYELTGVLSEQFGPMRRSPKTLMTAAEKLPPGPTRTAVSKALLSSLLVVSEHKMMVDWLAKNPDPDAAKIIPQHPQLPRDFHALEDMLDVMPNVELTQELLRKGVEVLARAGDFEGAFQFHSSLVAGSENNDVTQSLARYYYLRDPEAALDWAKASGQDAAVQGVIGAMAIMDPASAAPLLPSIQDSKLRAQVEQDLMKQWRREDSAGLSAWLDAQPGMNPVLKAELMAD
jgi:hypothetical protein